MTPERIAELRRGYVEQEPGFHFRGASRDEIDDLLATAEREAKLREALDNMADLWLTVGGTEDNPVYADAVAALEQKGGASDDT